MTDSEALDALLAGKAFVDLSSWRKIVVTGSDAFGWLNDLVSADLDGLRKGRSRRSLLLSPTGRVRADFTVTVYGQGLLILQDSEQPHSIDELLNRYVLSSNVALVDRAKDLALFCVPERSQPLEIGRVESFAPSCLGPGIDAICAMEDHEEAMAVLAKTLRRARAEDIEWWRAFRGIPRFGVDVGEDDLPQEGGLDEAVSFEKGCYLGQEAVAKVRNLGHPRRVLLHLEAGRAVSVGEPVCVEGTRVGQVTSAAESAKGTRVLAKVRWDARGGPFATPDGAHLVPVIVASSVAGIA